MAQGAERTADDVLRDVDLRDTTAVVTGGASGIGAVTAQGLAAAGATVVLAVRRPEQGEEAARQIADAVGDATIEVGQCDLSSLDSVRRFADEVTGRHSRLGLLVNDAGVMAAPLGRTADGFELQLGTNHLGHFLLTCLLVPALLAGAPARVVNLSSRGHLRSDIHWDDPHYHHRPYDKWEAYGQSKTANILFTVELDRRLRDRGLRAYAVHPGVIMTNLARHLTRDDLAEMAGRMESSGGMALKSPEAGAATSLWAATAPELGDIGGVYLEDCHVSEKVAGPEAPSGHAPWALDPDAARRLWQWSETQVGQRFTF